MRWTRKTAILCLTAGVISTGSAQTFASSEAKNHIGERTTVCGKVASKRTASSSRGNPTFINLDAPYPNEDFTILIWGDDRPSVGQMPRVGTRVCASGTIQEYRGVPEVVVRSSGQLKSQTISNTSSPSSYRNDRYYTNSDGQRVHSPTQAPSAPAGATAQCRDGSYSFSQHRQGTCSHHGGVARWL